MPALLLGAVAPGSADSAGLATPSAARAETAGATTSMRMGSELMSCPEPVEAVTGPSVKLPVAVGAISRKYVVSCVGSPRKSLKLLDSSRSDTM